MTHQTVLELSNPFDCIVRGHDWCLAKFLILGSTSGNPQYIVRQYHTGEHSVVDMKDIREYGNPSAGESLIPKIPEEWKR